MIEGWIDQLRTERINQREKRSISTIGDLWERISDEILGITGIFFYYPVNHNYISV